MTLQSSEHDKNKNIGNFIGNVQFFVFTNLKTIKLK